MNKNVKMTKGEKLEIEIEIIKNFIFKFLYTDNPLTEHEKQELERLIRSLRKKEQQLKELEEN